MKIQAQIKKDISQYTLFCFVFAATLLFGLCAHAYRFFNLDFSHDSMLIYERPDMSWQISLGRFAQPLYWEVRGDLTAPFLLGLLSLVWMALANYIVISLLAIHSPRHTALLCGLLSTNAVLTFSYATFLPWVDIYMLAYLLAALAAWLAVRFSWGFWAAWVPLALSLALYQSYLNVTIILLMIVFIKHIIDGLDTKALLIRIAKYLSALLGGLILYYVVLQIVLSGTAVSLSDTYNGISQVGNYENISLVGLIRKTVEFPVRHALHPETYHPRAAALINIAVGLASAVALIRVTLARKPAKVPALLLVLCMLAMPFGVNAVYFVSKGTQHSLMIFSFFLLYAFAFMLWEYHSLLPPARFPRRVSEAAKRIRTLFPPVSSGLLLLVILFNIVFANQVYLKKALEYQATMAYMTKLTYSIEQTEGYVPGETPVIVVGPFETSSLFAEREGFENFIDDYGLDRRSAVTYSTTFKQFFNSVLSYQINWIDSAAARDYAAWPEVRAMPVYPAKGSCQIVNGVLVAKIRDVYADSASE